MLGDAAGQRIEIGAREGMRGNRPCQSPANPIRTSVRQPSVGVAAFQSFKLLASRQTSIPLANT